MPELKDSLVVLALRLLVLLAAGACISTLGSCTLTGEDGQTYMTIRKDTAWAVFDRVEISWVDSATGEGEVLFTGDPDELKASNRFEADDYRGQKVRIVIKGFNDDTLVYEEHRVFDGASPKTVEKIIVPLLPPGTKEGRPQLSPIQADTEISIRDSVSFSATAQLPAGSLKGYAWDYDGDGAVDDSAALSGTTAVLKGGYRYDKARTYPVVLKVYAASDSMTERTVEVDVLQDPPTADAGPDRTVFTGGTVELEGIGNDRLGQVVTMEWRIGQGSYSAGSGKAGFRAPLEPGDVVAGFRVTDDDSQSTMDEVVIHVVSRTEANLTGIGLSSGRLSPDFNPSVTSYQDTVSHEVDSITVTPTGNGTLTVQGTDVESGKPSKAIPLPMGRTTVTVEVRLGAGPPKTYTVDVVRRAAPVLAGLSSLSLSASNLAPTFSRTVLEYSSTVSEKIDSVQVVASTVASAMGLRINGKPSVSGAPVYVPLATGGNLITVVVTAGAGDSAVYTVQVTRPGNRNAELSGLSLSAGTILPVFSPETVFYTLDVPNGTASTGVTADAARATSTLAVNSHAAGSGTPVAVDLAVGLNPITIAVTAQSGEKKTYTVVVTRAKNAEADLKSLGLSKGALSPPFAPGLFTYAVTVANEIDSLSVLPDVSAATSTLTVNGTGMASGTTSKPLGLKVGENPIEVIVTAQSGAARVYLVKVNRLPNPDAALFGLAVAPGALDSAFLPRRTAYRVSLPHSAASVLITPAAAHSAASITVAGKALVSGSASVALQVGENPIEIRVTAESGASQVYTLTVSREGSGNADLASLSVSQGTLVEPFSPATTTYNLSLPNSANALTVSALPIDSNASVAYSPAATTNLNTGLNVITVEVTAQNKAKKTYTVRATRAANSLADLLDLKLSGGSIPLAFNPATLAYAVPVGNEVASMTVTPTVSAASSSVTVKAVAVASGSASGALHIAVGPNLIPVVVTAEDGTRKTYELTVTRANDNPVVSGLKDTTISINDAITFNLSATDPQGIKEYRWDFNGDGVNEAVTASGTQSRTFPGTPQAVQVRVTVADNAGGTTMVQATITVIQDPPVVSAGRDTNVAVGRSILVKGSATDQLGLITLLEWSIGGGPFIRASKPETTVTAPSVQNLDYRIVLRATDNDGNVVTSTMSAKVEKINHVVVGERGYIATSSDFGVTWTRRNPGVTDLFTSVIWTGTQYVAVGTCIMTSPDGMVWTLRSARGLTDLAKVAWNGSLFVAVGFNGIIRTSPDGVTWTLRNSPTNRWLRTVTWTGNRWITVGATADSVFHSTDGITWSEQQAEYVYYVKDMAWTGSRFLAVGEVGILLASPDGLAWSYVDGGNPHVQDAYAIAKSPDRLLTVGMGGLTAMSTDGTAWTAGTVGTDDWLLSAAWTGGQWLVTAYAGKVFTSPDGVTWTARPLGFNGQISSSASPPP